eukprot:7205065-Prymnesium_polylepis.1
MRWGRVPPHPPRLPPRAVRLAERAHDLDTEGGEARRRQLGPEAVGGVEGDGRHRLVHPWLDKGQPPLLLPAWRSPSGGDATGR